MGNRLRGLASLGLQLLVFASVLSAQTPAPSAILAGVVSDPSGGRIASADVKVMSGTALVKETKTDGLGNFKLELPPGSYVLEVSVVDFSLNRQPIRVVANMPALSIRMVVETANTTQLVEDETKQRVTVDPDSTLTATVLKGDAINALPDDDDLLLAQLQQIAGAGGSTNGSATIVVDGFTGGRVPSRDQIQQIIIETNSFSAESNGGQRIQIITKPGTGPWTGTMNAGYQNQTMNARNPFDANKPARRMHIFQTTYGGPVIPGKLTLRMNARSVQQEQEAGSIVAITPAGPVNTGVFSPNINRNVGLSGQLFLTKTQTFNFTGNYNTNAAKNQGIGGFTLQERALNFKGHNINFQLSERAIINSKLTSEVRFAYFHNQNSLLPVTEAVGINVLDAFYGGGAQNRTRRRNSNYNFGNTIRWAIRPSVNLQIGSDFTYTDAYSNSETNYLGVFTFSSLADFQASHPVTFRQTTGNPLLIVRQLEGAAFIQADWRVNNKLNIGAGARYQAQTNLSDYNNIAPTFQVAYQLRKGTVVRAGARLSYQTYNLGNTEQLIRQNGANQIETVITNPSYPDPSLNGTVTATAINGSIRTRDPNLVAPYTFISAWTLEQDLRKGWKFSTSFDVNRAVHLTRSRNINAPYPGGSLDTDLFSRLNSLIPSIQLAAQAEVDSMRPFYPVVGNIYQYESAGNAFSKNWNVKLYLPPKLKLYKFGVTGMIQYTLGWTDDDSSAVNQYDWRSEWALASSDTRHRMQGNLTLTAPWKITANLLLSANSGRPYSITTGRDDNGDQSTNDRPGGVSRNSATGPGGYNIDGQFSKEVALKKPPAPARAGVPAAAGSAAAVPVTTAPVPKLVFLVQGRNILNNTQLRGYSGVQTSPLFGKPTGTAPGRSLITGVTMTW